jgi:transposase
MIMLKMGIYDKPCLRQTIEGIFYRLRAGCPWRDLPGALGIRLTHDKTHAFFQAKSGAPTRFPASADRRCAGFTENLAEVGFPDWCGRQPDKHDFFYGFA